MSDGAKKRKRAADATSTAKRPRFPGKPQHNISTMPTSSAYPNGEVNVNNFLKSHENEIRSLENAMKLAKKGLARRAFQDVPIELRRRTASHNPQRVPKRLRARARQEAKEDNTPISRGQSGSGVGKGKNKWLRKEGIEKSRSKWEKRAKRRKDKKDVDTAVDTMEGVEVSHKGELQSSKQRAKSEKKRRKFPALATPQTPPSRFRRRQKTKTWLPTHLWHTKRALMTPPKEPLWRFAVPLAPVVKAYRLTHRAAAQRGAVAWDMSYTGTIGLEGGEASIAGLLRGLHFAEEDGNGLWQERGKGKKWRNGTRVWEGCVYERESKPPKEIAQIVVIWCPASAESSKRKAFIRVHPSGFLHVWNDVIRLAKVQKPAVTVEDLRFEIGAIEITGPAAAETLCSILYPCTSSESPPETPQALWPTLAAVTDVSVLPPGALLSFPISDPRLRDPPATTHVLRTPESQTALIELLASWPIDNAQTTSTIFDRGSRLAAGRALSSQKSINRRKAACTMGGYPEPRSTDAQIPMLAYTSKKSRSWTVLLPWKCVDPVWRAIMRYPVSTGGTPRFGGLKERRQIDFEHSTPSFPFDHPGTDAGWGWELQERAVKEQEWTKRPKGKRIEWSTIDLGNGRKGEVGDPWACAWEKLVSKASQSCTADKTQSPFRQLPSQDASELIAGRPISIDHGSTSHLFTVKISMAQRGTPTNCARVYRLPTSDQDLRTKWLSLMPGPRSTASTERASRKRQRPKDENVPQHVQRRMLAASLLEPLPGRDGPLKAGDEGYPAVPDEDDLIGFVTTGNYNLAEGMPTAIANLALHRVLDRAEQGSGGKGVPKNARVCIVREAGHSIGRLATWEIV